MSTNEPETQGFPLTPDSPFPSRELRAHPFPSEPFLPQLSILPSRDPRAQDTTGKGQAALSCPTSLAPGRQAGSATMAEQVSLGTS